MAQYFGFGASEGSPGPVRRRIFVSYHHGGDQKYYEDFSSVFHEKYDLIYDNSLERRIDSENVEYVLQRIRNTCIEGSSCTIILCGLETPWRKYVDWEIKATLDMEHGLVGINLPSNQCNSNGNYVVPARLHDNIQTKYAIWMAWDACIRNPSNLNGVIEEAIGRPKNLIDNHREMMSRNGVPPWQR